MVVRAFPIRQNPAMRVLVTPMGGRQGAVTVDGDEVTVRYGVGFRATFPRSAIRGVEPWSGRVGGWGAHGWRGRWLVNGSSKGIVRLVLDPEQRARVLGVPVKLRELRVSVDDPDGLLSALR